MWHQDTGRKFICFVTMQAFKRLIAEMGKRLGLELRLESESPNRVPVFARRALQNDCQRHSESSSRARSKSEFSNRWSQVGCKPRRMNTYIIPCSSGTTSKSNRLRLSKKASTTEQQDIGVCLTVRPGSWLFVKPRYNMLENAQNGTT